MGINAQKKYQNKIYSNTADWSYDEVPLTVYRRNERKLPSKILSGNNRRNRKSFFSAALSFVLRIISSVHWPHFQFEWWPQISFDMHLLPNVGSLLGKTLRVVIPLLVLFATGYGIYRYRFHFNYRQRLMSAPVWQEVQSTPLISAVGGVNPERAYTTARAKDTLSSVLARFGIDSDEAQQVESLLISDSKQLDAKQKEQKEKRFKLKVGQQIEYRFSREKHLWELVVVNSEGVQFAIRKNDAGKLQQKQVELRKIEKERIAVGVIYSSFADAARKSGVSYELIDDMVDLFSNRVEFNRDLQKGDRFTLILSGRELEDGTVIGDNVILAAALSVNGKQLKAVRYVGSDGKARYFDETGQLIGDFFLRYPLKFSHISSAFSYARFHPILKTFRPHQGVDFAAAAGTPVRSVADGVIRFAGYKGAAGKMVEIAHGPRYLTNYLHLSRINSEIRSGARVTRGQIIGAVGNTGRSTGPHLHYGFYDSGKYVDPLKIKLPVMDDLPKGGRMDSRYMQKVVFTLDNYQAMKVDKPQWYQ